MPESTPLDKLAEYVKGKPGTPMFEALWESHYQTWAGPKGWHRSLAGDDLCTYIPENCSCYPTGYARRSCPEAMWRLLAGTHEQIAFDFAPARRVIACKLESGVWTDWFSTHEDALSAAILAKELHG